MPMWSSMSSSSRSSSIAGTLSTVTSLRHGAKPSKAAVVAARYADWTEGHSIPAHRYTLPVDVHHNIDTSDWPEPLALAVERSRAWHMQGPSEGTSAAKPAVTDLGSHTDVPASNVNPAQSSDLHIAIRVENVTHPGPGLREPEVSTMSAEMRTYMDTYEPTGHAGEPHAFEVGSPSLDERPYEWWAGEARALMESGKEEHDWTIKDSTTEAVLFQLTTLILHPAMRDQTLMVARDDHEKRGTYEFCWELVAGSPGAYIMGVLVGSKTILYMVVVSTLDGRTQIAVIRRPKGMKNAGPLLAKSRRLGYKLNPFRIADPADFESSTVSYRIISRSRHIKDIISTPIPRKATNNGKRVNRGHYNRVKPVFADDDRPRALSTPLAGTAARVASEPGESELWETVGTEYERVSGVASNTWANPMSLADQTTDQAGSASIVQTLTDAFKRALAIKHIPFVKPAKRRSASSRRSRSIPGAMRSLLSKASDAATSDPASSSIPSSISVESSDVSPLPPPGVGEANLIDLSSPSLVSSQPSEAMGSETSPSDKAASSDHDQVQSVTSSSLGVQSIPSTKFDHSSLSDHEYQDMFGRPRHQKAPFVEPERPFVPSSPRVRGPRPLPRPPSSAARSSHVEDDKQPPYTPYRIPPANIRRSPGLRSPVTSQADQDKAMQEVFDEPGHENDSFIRMVAPRQTASPAANGNRFAEPTLLRDHDDEPVGPVSPASAAAARPTPSSVPPKPKAATLPTAAAAAPAAAPAAGGQDGRDAVRSGQAPQVAKKGNDKGKAKDDSASVKSSTSSKGSKKSTKSKSKKKSKGKGKAKAPTPPTTPPRSPAVPARPLVAPAPAAARAVNASSARSSTTPARAPATPARVRGYATSGNTLAITEAMQHGWPDFVGPADMAEREDRWMNEIDSHREGDPYAPVTEGGRSREVQDWISEVERALLAGAPRDENGEPVRRVFQPAPLSEHDGDIHVRRDAARVAGQPQPGTQECEDYWDEELQAALALSRYEAIGI